jgi:hypothetical protein
MADLRRLYSSLAEDADTTRLPAAAAVRRTADRRARTATVATSVAALVFVAGTLLAVDVWVGARPQPPASAGPTAPPSPPPATTAPDDAPVPDAAFVTVPTNPPEATPADGGTFLPAMFCGLAPTDERVRTQRTRTIPYHESPTVGSSPDASVHQTVTVYQSGGAERFMLQLRTVTEDCHNDPDGGAIVDYRPASAGGPGDDYVLVERTTDPTGPPAATLSYLVAIRLGDVVTVLNVYGPDGRDADRGVTDYLVERAVSAISQWRD